MQRIPALNVDAIMGIALPMPHSDSCGCVLSHLLGVPFIDINGHPMVDAPVTVPQVRCAWRQLLSHRQGLSDANNLGQQGPYGSVT
jgi:hypothetical protein